MEQLALKIEAGQVVVCYNEQYRILRLMDLTTVLARNVNTQEVKRLFVHELEPPEENDKCVPVNQYLDLATIPELEWEKARKRYAIIELLLNNNNGMTVKMVAAKEGIHEVTIYRWLQKFNRTGTLSSLIDEKNNGGKGKSRLNEEVEVIINAVINDRYLNKQKLTVTKITKEIAAKCRQGGLSLPNYQTVRKRISDISEEKKLASRYHRSLASNKYEPIKGCFPGADYPLSFVQIDHTLLDIVIVDDIYRKPVGRPWVTVAIDVYSRMITGFYISLDTPGTYGTGLCLSRSILPKEMWLSKLDIKGQWPCCGIMKSLHMDNAKEFHGNMLQRACQEYGIVLNFRPVAKPQYGGHIERLLGTVLQEIHTLPGTTFSNPKDRKYYKSKEKACLSISELEKWMVEFIVNVYHQRFHSAINMSPLAKYTEGILGTSVKLGIGLRRTIENELKLKLDFMPIIKRTIQRYGVVIDFICYYSDILRKWVNIYDDKGPKNLYHRKFIFKRDPRDISVVYFYDPEQKDYFAIPYRNTSLPPTTQWEHYKAIKEAKRNGVKDIDEQMIFEAYERMKDIEKSAAKNTFHLRKLRNKTSVKQGLEKSIKQEFLSKIEPVEESLSSPVSGRKILPFEDIDDVPFK